jgi:hypothetical protein
MSVVSDLIYKHYQAFAMLHEAQQIASIKTSLKPSMTVLGKSIRMLYQIASRAVPLRQPIPHRLLKPSSVRRLHAAQAPS